MGSFLCLYCWGHNQTPESYFLCWFRRSCQKNGNETITVKYVLWPQRHLLILLLWDGDSFVNFSLLRSTFFTSSYPFFPSFYFHVVLNFIYIPQILLLFWPFPFFSPSFSLLFVGIVMMKIQQDQKQLLIISTVRTYVHMYMRSYIHAFM